LFGVVAEEDKVAGCEEVDEMSEPRIDGCGSFALAALRDNVFAFLL
jgi:hypothetical protein